MIQIEIGVRLLRTLRRLGPEISAEAEIKLARITEEFGQPHAHSGLGLRKIGRHSYEARLGLKWRLVLVRHVDRLLAYDVMSHDEVARWLKSGN